MASSKAFDPKVENVQRWRACHARLSNQHAQRLAGLWARASRILPEAVFQRALRTWLKRYASPAVPGLPAAWIHLHATLFVDNFHDALEQAPRKTKRNASRQERKRIFLLGPFSGLLSYPPQLFERLSDAYDWTFIDLEFRNCFAHWLKDTGHEHITISEQDGPVAQRDAAVAAIEAGQPDVLVNFYHRRLAHEIIDRTSTPLVVDIPTGTDLQHSRNVDVCFYQQPQVYYEPKAGTLYCHLDRAPMNDLPLIKPGLPFYDHRDLVPRADDHETEPVILGHGSLYKFSAEPFVSCVAEALVSVPKATFRLCGQDDGASLNKIRKILKRHGALEQLDVREPFSAMRDPTSGMMATDGRDKLQALLNDARVVGNPWPIGGASARFEAYHVGIPVLHLAPAPLEGPHTGPAGTLVDHPALLTRTGTVPSPAAYTELMIDVLKDARRGAPIVQEQRAVARHASNPDRFWRDLLCGITMTNAPPGPAEHLTIEAIP